MSGFPLQNRAASQASPIVLPKEPWDHFGHPIFSDAAFHEHFFQASGDMTEVSPNVYRAGVGEKVKHVRDREDRLAKHEETLLLGAIHMSHRHPAHRLRSLTNRTRWKRTAARGVWICSCFILASSENKKQGFNFFEFRSFLYKTQTKGLKSGLMPIKSKLSMGRLSWEQWRGAFGSPTTAFRRDKSKKVESDPKGNSDKFFTFCSRLLNQTEVRMK